jgi:large subunit ribosomal protein L14e
MYEVGRIVIKIAGRDAGNTAIVVDKVDKNNVLIDGNVRRRKCNISHLEPKNEILKIKKGASTSEVHKIMSAAGIKVVEQKKVKRSAKKEAPKKTVKKTTKKKTAKKE